MAGVALHTSEPKLSRQNSLAWQPVVKAPLHSSGQASRLDCVAPRSNMPNILPRRALPARRLTALRATRGFTTGCQNKSMPPDGTLAPGIGNPRRTVAVESGRRLDTAPDAVHSGGRRRSVGETGVAVSPRTLDAAPAPLPHHPPRGAVVQQPVVKAPLHSSGQASRLDCVAPRSNMPNILPRRALPARRLTALGATRGFTTGCQAPGDVGRRPGLLPVTFAGVDGGRAEHHGLGKMGEPSPRERAEHVKEPILAVNWP